MLNTIIPHEMGGNVDLDYGKDGVVCTLLPSAQHFTEKDAVRGRHKTEACAAPVDPDCEDVGLVATEVANHLRDGGFDIVGPASSQAEALNATEEQRVAAAIVDLNLQGESAVPLIRRLKGRGIPVLVTTGYQVDTTLSDELRDVPSLAKPYRTSNLMQRLRELIGKADQS
jgi:CheY-like chemotaxis protein